MQTEARLVQVHPYFKHGHTFLTALWLLSMAVIAGFCDMSDWCCDATDTA